MKRKAVRLTNAKIYIFSICRTERNKAHNAFTAKKEEKERLRVVKTRTGR